MKLRNRPKSSERSCPSNSIVAAIGIVSTIGLLMTVSPVSAQTSACTGDIATCQATPQSTPQTAYGQPATGAATSGYGSSTPGYGSSTPAYGSNTPAYGSSGYGSSSSSGYGTSSYGNSGAASSVQGAPASSLGQRGGTSSYGSSSYGQQASPYGASSAGGFAAQAAQASSGPCSAWLLDDRSTIALGDSAGDRKHVALGQDHVQQIFTSPDGAWAVAVFKVRGRTQYGAVVLDLAHCAQSDSVDLTNAADAAEFNGTEVALTSKSGTNQSLSLKPAQP
jgi:hypothetical protein